MQDLKDLKRFLRGCDRGGQAPALRARKVLLKVRRTLMSIVRADAVPLKVL